VDGSSLSAASSFDGSRISLAAAAAAFSFDGKKGSVIQ